MKPHPTHSTPDEQTQPYTPLRYDESWLMRGVRFVAARLQQLGLLNLLLWLADGGLLVAEALRGGVRGVLEHLALHLLRHRAGRATVRFFVGLILLITATLMTLLPLFDRPIQPAELVTVRGVVTGFARDVDGDFQILLAGYTQPFAVAANARTFFPAAQFEQAVPLGTTVEVAVRQRQWQQRATADQLVIFELRREQTAYLTLPQINTASQRSSHGQLIAGIVGLVIGALLMREIVLILIIVAPIAGVVLLLELRSWLGW